MYFSEITNDWSLTFIIIGMIFAISSIFIITVEEQKLERENINIFSFSSIFNSVIKPFKEFFIRQNSLLILLAIIFF